MKMPYVMRLEARVRLEEELRRDREAVMATPTGIYDNRMSTVRTAFLEEQGRRHTALNQENQKLRNRLLDAYAKLEKNQTLINKLQNLNKRIHTAVGLALKES